MLVNTTSLKFIEGTVKSFVVEYTGIKSSQIFVTASHESFRGLHKRLCNRFAVSIRIQTNTGLMQPFHYVTPITIKGVDDLRCNIEVCITGVSQSIILDKEKIVYYRFK